MTLGEKTRWRLPRSGNPLAVNPLASSLKMQGPRQRVLLFARFPLAVSLVQKRVDASGILEPGAEEGRRQRDS